MGTIVWSGPSIAIDTRSSSPGETDRAIFGQQA